MAARRDNRVGAALALGLTVLAAQVGQAAELIPKGIYYWRGEGEGFGGFSGLWIGASGGELLAVSDHGMMLDARISRDARGRIKTISRNWQAQMRDNFDREVSGFTADAEALAVAEDGTAYVGFESYTRIVAYHPPDMTPQPLHAWDRFQALWGNHGFESLALHPTAGLFAIVEGQKDGARKVFVQDGRDWVEGPVLPAGEDYDLSDAGFDDDGRLYLLERRFAYTAGYATRLSRRAFGPDGFGAAEILLDTAPGELDNMEGLSLWHDNQGRQMVSLISDDNFLPFQNTIIAEYELRE